MELNSQTRLHSSRMRTARALTVSPSMLCAGGGLLLGGGVSEGSVCSGGCLLRGCLLQGVSAGICSGGVCSRGMSASKGGVCIQGVGGVCIWGVGGGIPACTEADPLLTESQMPVKTLPCPNFVAGGKDDKVAHPQELGFSQSRRNWQYCHKRLYDMKTKKVSNKMLPPVSIEPGTSALPA